MKSLLPSKHSTKKVNAEMKSYNYKLFKNVLPGVTSENKAEKITCLMSAILSEPKKLVCGPDAPIDPNFKASLQVCF